MNAPMPAQTTPATPTPSADPLGILTDRERQVALALGCEATNREIAASLNISIKTVDTHRGHILKKLALKNNVALARLLIRLGAVQP